MYVYNFQMNCDKVKIAFKRLNARGTRWRRALLKADGFCIDQQRINEMANRTIDATTLRADSRTATQRRHRRPALAASSAASQQWISKKRRVRAHLIASRRIHYAVNVSTYDAFTFAPC